MIRTRLISVICLAALLISTSCSFSAVYAEDSQNNTATRAVYYFDPHEVGDDLTDTFIFDDSLLKGDSLAYNKQLATMSFELAIASISSEREPKTAEGYANKSRNLKAYLEDNGFTDFDTNEYYKQKPTMTSMGAACAHKKIVDNGKTYTLLAIVPRSAGYESEWGGNFMIGESGDHEGFKNGKNIVLKFAKEYVEKYGIEGDIKVWTAGYSRGAGVTNQVGAALIKDARSELGSGINLTPENLYCYTFGTPNSAADPNGESGDYSDSKFDYIHNTWEPYDLVTIAPPQKFGFNRYGTNTGYDSAANKSRMLEFLEATNKVVYDIYTNGCDPDGFTPYKLDLDAIGKMQLKLVEDKNSYLPGTQAEFLALMEDSIVEAVKYDDKTGLTDPRKIYYDAYQGPMARLLGYYFSHTESGGDLIDGIKGSKFAIPMAVGMYVTFITERYGDNTFSRDNMDALDKAIGELEEYLNKLEEQGETVPEEISDQLEKLIKKRESAETYGDFTDFARVITAHLYAETISDGLSAAGLDKEDPEMFAKMTDPSGDGAALSRILTYLLLYDKSQKEEISFDYLNQQFKHLATFIGNAGSYMRPHNNEVILSWLRAQDSSYDDFVKEDAPKISGYRRAYIAQPEGVTVTGAVKDESGKTLATFSNGEITSRTDPWIGITTSDNGNWLRLPVDKTYRISLSTDKEASLDLRAAEYDISSNEEVRTETSDENYDWTGIKLSPSDEITWILSAVPGSEYKLASDAHYYIEISRGDSEDDSSVDPEDDSDSDDSADDSEGGGSRNKARVHTGDENNMVMWLISMLASLAILSAMIVCRINRNRQDR